MTRVRVTRVSFVEDFVCLHTAVEGGHLRSIGVTTIRAWPHAALFLRWRMRRVQQSCPSFISLFVPSYLDSIGPNAAVLAGCLLLDSDSPPLIRNLSNAHWITHDVAIPKTVI